MLILTRRIGGRQGKRKISYAKHVATGILQSELYDPTRVAIYANSICRGYARSGA